MPQGESQRSVLVIDDEAGVRKMVKLLLERKGYRVLTAAGGEEGLILAKVERPDAILLDIIMPKMNGHEVLRRLKRDPDTEHVPVVVVTAKGGDRDRAESFRLGAVDHIEKPYKTHDVLQKVMMTFVLGERNDPDRPNAPREET